MGVLSIDWLLAAINVPPEAMAQAREYSVICLRGMFSIFGYNTVSTILRGMGDSRKPLVFIAIAAVSNLLLELLFVAAFGWGAGGAALATVIGQGISFVVSLATCIGTRSSLVSIFASRALCRTGRC